MYAIAPCICPRRGCLEGRHHPKPRALIPLREADAVGRFVERRPGAQSGEISAHHTMWFENEPGEQRTIMVDLDHMNVHKIKHPPSRGDMEELKLRPKLHRHSLHVGIQRCGQVSAVSGVQAVRA